MTPLMKFSLTKKVSSFTGYPSKYYNKDTLSARPWSWMLDLSDIEFKESIRNLYPVLKEKEFSLLTVDQRKSFKPAPFQISYFKMIKYQGTVVIRIQVSNTISTTNVRAMRSLSLMVMLLKFTVPRSCKYFLKRRLSSPRHM